MTLAYVTINDLMKRWGEALYKSNNEQEQNRKKPEFIDFYDPNTLLDKKIKIASKFIGSLPKRVRSKFNLIARKRNKSLEIQTIKKNSVLFLKEIEAHYKQKGVFATHNLFPNKHPANIELMDRFIDALYSMELDGLKNHTFKKEIKLNCPKNKSKKPARLIKNWK